MASLRYGCPDRRIARVRAVLSRFHQRHGAGGEEEPHITLATRHRTEGHRAAGLADPLDQAVRGQDGARDPGGKLRGEDEERLGLTLACTPTRPVRVVVLVVQHAVIIVIVVLSVRYAVSVEIPRLRVAAEEIALGLGDCRRDGRWQMLDNDPLDVLHRYDIDVRGLGSAGRDSRELTDECQAELRPQPAGRKGERGELFEAARVGQEL